MRCSEPLRSNLVCIVLLCASSGFLVSHALALNVVLNECSESSLNSAVHQVVKAGGGAIRLFCPPGTIIPVAEEKRFSGNKAAFILEANNPVVLDAARKSRILYSQAGDRLKLTLRNLIFKNGYAGHDSAGERAANQGGAIYSGYFNTLVVENCAFVGNQARAQRNHYHGGGAIAIDSESTARIKRSTFSSNKAPSGGAINGLRTDLRVEGCTFTDNTSTADRGGGGALYNDGGKVTVIDSILSNNSTSGIGGGFFDWANHYKGAKHSGPTLIRNSLFYQNRAPMGGAVWKGGNRLLTMESSAVIENAAGKIGGGLAGTGPGPNFKIVNCTFASNRVLKTGSAGALYSGGNTTTIINSTFAWNRVLNDGGSVGGAIHADRRHRAKIRNSIFAFNTGGWNKIRGCFGGIKNTGGNIQYPNNSCGGMRRVDPLLRSDLMPLITEVFAGGKTPLFPLDPASPAAALGRHCPAFDQHATARHKATCSAGAYELRPF